MRAHLKISVIIPSFNQGQFIEETFNSLWAQNYSNLEVIVIDGGSTDNTLEIIRKHEPKISYWISETDSGQSEAINKGFKKASGEIITWLNSDDYYNKNTLNAVSEFFGNNPDVDFLHGRARLFGKGKDKVVGIDKEISVHEYFPYMRFPQPSSFFRKKLLEDFGWINENLHYTMDFEFVCRILLGGAKIKFIDTVFSNYRLHEDSKTNDTGKFLDEWLKIVKSILTHFEAGKPLAAELIKLFLPQKSGVLLQFEKVRITLSEKELRDIFLQHLNLWYHTLYQQMEFKECHRISKYLKTNHPGFYKTQQLGKFDLRARCIPAFIFKLLR